MANDNQQGELLQELEPLEDEVGGTIVDGVLQLLRDAYARYLDLLKQVR